MLLALNARDNAVATALPATPKPSEGGRAVGYRRDFIFNMEVMSAPKARLQFEPEATPQDPCFKMSLALKARDKSGIVIFDVLNRSKERQPR